MILLHAPGDAAGTWADLPETLRSYGVDVVAPQVRETDGMRYVARASLVIAAAAARPPLVLVGKGAAGPLLPALAAAQRAAHRAVGAYVFMDAATPVTRTGHQGHDHSEESTVPVPADWPEAPCGYLVTDGPDSQDTPPVRQARLRGWPVRILNREAGESSAQALTELIATL